MNGHHEQSLTTPALGTKTADRGSRRVFQPAPMLVSLTGSTNRPAQLAPIAWTASNTLRRPRMLVTDGQLSDSSLKHP